MGIWKGFECINLCADTYTKSRMHVDVPSMWYYGMPYEMHRAFRDNHINERLAYRHIGNWQRHKPDMSAHGWHVTLAFLGLDDGE